MNVAVVAAGGLVGFGLLVAHNVGDQWAQMHRQACDKGQPGWLGRLACLKHVISYTVCTTLAVGLLWALFDLPISWAGFLVGQLVSAVSHYWADRRTTLEKLCDLLGKGEFYRLGQPRVDKNDNPCLGTGAYALDQAWHWFFLFIATIVTVTL